MEDLANRKEAAAQEKEKKRLEVSSSRTQKDAEKRQKEALKLERRSLMQSKKIHKAAWSAKAIASYGDKLHALIKENSSVQTWKSPYCGFPPPTCRENQKRALARRRARKRGESTSHLPALLEVPKPWMGFQSNVSCFNPQWPQYSGYSNVSFPPVHMPTTYSAAIPEFH